MRKLAILREDKSDGCPFGLKNIPNICKVVGDSIKEMAPAKDSQDIIKINMSKVKNKGKCPYLNKIVNNEVVDCAFDEKMNAEVVNSNYDYSQEDKDRVTGLNGAYEFSFGFTGDSQGDIMRNQYNNVYNILANNGNKMPLKQAQLLLPENFHIDLPDFGEQLNDIVVYEDKPSKDEVLDVHEQVDEMQDGEGELEKAQELLKDEDTNVDVQIESDDDSMEVVIKLDKVPGAEDQSDIVEEVKEDSNEVKNSDEDKKSPWYWDNKDLSTFLGWVKQRIESIPRHSGKEASGIERAIAYLDRVDSEISKAMKSDLEGLIDSNQIETIRKEIDDGISRLRDRLDQILKGSYKSKSKSKKKKAEQDFLLVKEAQKVSGVHGVIVTVPLLISRIARVCINSHVSAGHDLNDTFKKQAKLYKLSDREKAEVVQLLDDMGYTIRMDRGYLPDDSIDIESSENSDWAANYPA